MSDPSRNEILDPASGKSQVFPTSVEAGTFYYYEVCKEMVDRNYTTVRHPSVVAPYAYGDRYWYGFDDPTSVMSKAQYIVQLKMAGAMIWSIDTDDFLNICQGISANPIATTIRMVFESSAPLIKRRWLNHTWLFPFYAITFETTNAVSTMQFPLPAYKTVH